MADKKAEALKIIEDGLQQLESTKGSVAIAVQKLSRAANLLDEKDIYIWAEYHLANPKYTKPVQNLLDALNAEYKKENEDERNYDEVIKLRDGLSDFGLDYEMHVAPSIDMKGSKASGGLYSVDFIEENYNHLLKCKKGNDGELYQKNLKRLLDYIKKTAHYYLSELHNKLKFSGTITSSFDILKNAVDDRLLDLDPEIAEQLMLAFKAVSSDKKEEWSHALTTCRRLLESLADKLYPANDLVIGKRTFKQSQFVNRLWQFMNDSIESDSNRDLAQAHVNFLGSWLEKTNKLTNKGVHDDVSQLEATKALFHLYLMLADLLDYLDPSATKQTIKPQIATASLDELEALLNVKRDVAKAIVIARVKYNGLTLEQFKEIKGVGPKTIATAKEVFEFN
ncbi:ComEA family DNA-binding protein [Acinetobacter baumannii]|uniref:ComEA family DNA-binding protein n=1 Tax=Acinetobacter baumannii TaxID=470 RepID=UPI000F66E5CB|nr:helix-hairpin-helix domain-containing protein [Acinetobacter baumannii]MCT9188304.1 helix-hairpin-helix domain-containing protein [Acinetobacter baumannii]MDA4919913.1 helix-hairpin-helix domain-containing protein [Acinetobacter baumannii]MDC5201477.1 helix-hairpin-helix domain-containing protein [Acinetobacter baumannii]MDU3121679.1 helix-hairpin-helix domain-containing protein [Acinetobacter baumannii]RSF43654.1 helix-hairpin-helix domain-containing protein [Acinetobacter baumannii]